MGFRPLVEKIEKPVSVKEAARLLNQTEEEVVAILKLIRKPKTKRGKVG